MSDYVVYHNTERNDTSIIHNKSKNYEFDIYTTKRVDQLPGKIVWIIQGIKSPNGKQKDYYLCERFRVHDIETNPDEGENYAYGKPENAERYIGEKEILLNNLPWFPDFLKRMANFSLGLTPLKADDRNNFIAEIKKRGYKEALGVGKHAPPKLPSDKRATTTPRPTDRRFGDPETNPIVDQAAINCVKSYFKTRKWSITDKQKEKNLGYDLICNRGTQELHVEVKGCQGSDPVFFLKASQWHCAEKDDRFRLAIVTNALTNPTLKVFTGPELFDKFNLIPCEYRASLKTQKTDFQTRTGRVQHERATG